ncbi:MAG: hypothetical protein U0Q21_00310 [Dermatophilaceae bacterium]
MREPEPRLHGDDFDQRFAEIVAGLGDDPMFWDTTSSAPEPPSDGDAAPERGREDTAYGLTPTEPKTGVNPPLLPQSFPVWRGATGPTFDEALDDEDDHFIPAPPAPLPPQEDVHFWAMLICLVGGPLILLWLVVFEPDVGQWWTWLALSMCAAGFVLLVMRGPSDEEHDPGNGAIV